MPFSRPRGANLQLTIAVLTAVAMLLFPAVLAFSQTLSLSSSISRVAPLINFGSPTGIAIDSLGNIYVSDSANNCVRRIDVAGTVSVVAGVLGSNGTNVCSPAPAAPQASLNHPSGLAFDRNNRLYIADTANNCVRSLAPGTQGVQALKAVSGSCSGVSVLQAPSALAFDQAGFLYIATGDSSGGSASQVLRQASGVGTVPCVLAGQVLPGLAQACGSMPAALLSRPSGLAVDAAGTVFVADTGNDCVRQIAMPQQAAAAVTTILGICRNDGTGMGPTTLRAPFGLAVSHTGMLLMADEASGRVLSVRPGSPVAVPVAGSGAGSIPGAPTWTPAIPVALQAPHALAVDSFDRILLAESGTGAVLQMSTNQLFPQTKSGTSSVPWPITIANPSGEALAVRSSPEFPIVSETCSAGGSLGVCQIFITFSPANPGLRQGRLSVTCQTADTPLQIGLSGLAIGPLPVFLPGTLLPASPMAAATLMAVDSDGSLIVLEVSPAGYQAHRVSGDSDELLSNAAFRAPSAVAVSTAGSIFVADQALGTVTRIATDGTSASVLPGLDSPTGLAIDGFGNLLIAEAGDTHSVSRLLVSGLRQTIAGTGAVRLANAVPALNARFSRPGALALADDGTLYVADADDHAVYAISATGTIRLVVGDGDASATGSPSITPNYLATDAAGDLYLADAATASVFVLYPYAGLQNNLELLAGAGANGQAPFRQLAGLTVTASGDLLLLDLGDRALRHIARGSSTLLFNASGSGSTLAQRVLNAGTAAAPLASPVTPTDAHFSVLATTCTDSLRSGSLCDTTFSFSAADQSTNAVAAIAQNGLAVVQLQGVGIQKQALLALLPAASETYGQPFSMTAAFTNIGEASVPTGTFTFATADRTLCSVSGGSFGGAVQCGASASGLPVGRYPVRFTYSGDAHFAPYTAMTILTITRARLSVQVDNSQRPYASQNPVFTGRISGAAMGDTILVGFSTTATQNSPVGSYAVTATLSSAGGGDLSNYSVTTASGTLTISPAVLTVKATDATRVYGVVNPNLTGTVAGLAPGDQVSAHYATAASAGSMPGSYTIVASLSGNISRNYHVQLVDGTLRVDPVATATTLSGHDAMDGSGTVLTADVSSSTAEPVGAVVFADGETLLGQSSVDATGHAKLAVGVLTSGRHSFTARFIGGAIFLSSEAQMLRSVAKPNGSFSLEVTSAPLMMRGTQTSVPVTLSSVEGFTGAVALQCSGLPEGASCSFDHPTISLNKGASVTATMTITLPGSAATATVSSAETFSAKGVAPIAAVIFFPFELTAFGTCVAGMRQRRRMHRSRVLLILLFGAAVAGLTGCGTASVALQTYTLHVTASSVQAPADTQTAAVTVAMAPAR